ncbi:outer membrane lipoprotein carrier protein LolA [Salinisphaera sp. LB1]|uniref:outer membrane lipoprotein carrier protein LolA n=1 Tax=Salinisphaera sp. LB1 TaxID=2183911 RepID=UPI000D70595A|nr:outer membrane lipoprotein carrier protein LolA [Salinisphaera sp. LB1]
MRQAPRRLRHAVLARLIVLLIALAAGPMALAAQSGQGDMPALGQEASGHVLRGRFVQHKHLAELDRALVSRGHYVVARNRGLLWQVDKPVHSTLVITPQSLTESSQGQQTAHISAQQQPALGAVASILLAVFQGNTDQLSRYFKIQRPDQDSSGKTLTLTPRTDAVKHFITRLKISGGDSVRRIRIDQPGGDYSIIDLHPAQHTAKALTPAERRAFAR